MAELTRQSRELQVRKDRLQEQLIEAQLQARRAEEDAQQQHSTVTQLRGQLRKAEMQIDEFQPTNAKERARIVELEVALRQVKCGSTIVWYHNSLVFLVSCNGQYTFLMVVCMLQAHAQYGGCTQSQLLQVEQLLSESEAQLLEQQKFNADQRAWIRELEQMCHNKCDYCSRSAKGEAPLQSEHTIAQLEGSLDKCDYCPRSTKGDAPLQLEHTIAQLEGSLVKLGLVEPDQQSKIGDDDGAQRDGSCNFQDQLSARIWSTRKL